VHKGNARELTSLYDAAGRDRQGVFQSNMCAWFIRESEEDKEGTLKLRRRRVGFNKSLSKKRRMIEKKKTGR